MQEQKIMKKYVFGGTTAAPPAYWASRTVEEGVITVRNYSYSDYCFFNNQVSYAIEQISG